MIERIFGVGKLRSASLGSLSFSSNMRNRPRVLSYFCITILHDHSTAFLF